MGQEEQQFIYSNWHDYDFVYQMNDYLTDSGTCPEEQGIVGEYTLNSCKADIFDRNGIRYD